MSKYWQVEFQMFDHENRSEDTASDDLTYALNKAGFDIDLGPYLEADDD